MLKEADFRLTLDQLEAQKADNKLKWNDSSLNLKPFEPEVSPFEPEVSPFELQAGLF